MEALTLADLGFHWQANIFWKRTDAEGTVRVALARRRLDGSDLYDIVWAYNIDPSSWASIVASVSVGGGTGTSWRNALDFHGGSNTDLNHLDGAQRIAEERDRQVALGWSREHDADGALVRAAIMYCARAMPDASIGLTDLYWPWQVNEDDYGKKADPIRSLEKAGTLIAAEIDRLAASGETPT